MAQPTLPDMTEAEANAFAAGGADANTGIKPIPKNAEPGGSPTLHARMQQQIYHALQLLGGLNQGRVYPLGGLSVGVFALAYQIGATAKAYAGDATFALTASETNYLYLDADATLKKSTEGWPSGDHFKLAKIVAGATTITSIEDSRYKNFQVGVIDHWWETKPTAAVDLDSQLLQGMGGLGFDDPCEAEIDAGVLTVDRTVVAVATEDLDPTDDLETITAPDNVHLLILHNPNAGTAVTVKHATGNIYLYNGDFELTQIYPRLMLMRQWAPGGWLDGWVQLPVSTLGGLVQASLNCQGYDIANVGRLNIEDAESLTIASGEVTKTQSWAVLLNQGGGATDDLDTINGGIEGDVLILQAAQNEQVPTVKHATGNIKLGNGKSYVLADTEHRLVLQYDGSNWVELARSHWSIFHLSDSDKKGLRWEPAYYIGDTLTADTQYNTRVYLPVATTITQIHAYAVTAPSGGYCVVDCLFDDVSLFVSQQNMARIADGEHSDSSDAISETVGPGWLSFKTHDINGAGKLTVTVIGRRAVPAS